jgi:hypothetical protein
MSFKRLDPQDFLISSDSITSPLWTGYIPTLTTFFTSSTQEISSAGLYYLSVYQSNPSTSGSEVQFDLAYGDSVGSGSAFFDNTVTGSSPSRTIYGQYRNLVLGDENAGFVFGNISASNFLVVNLARTRYKESLLPGSLSLKLGSGSATIILTDDSRITTTNVFTDAGRLYNIVSGSAGTVYTGVNARGWAGGANALSGSYGWFLPDIGLLMLNPHALGATSGNGGILLNVSRSFNGDAKNIQTLFKAVVSGSFTLNSKETITSDYVFIRGRNAEFNYSENPSFISGSTGAVLFDSFINSPETYVTTIGLYNDANELLAVAKMSKPLKKNFTKEILVRVKLDF